MLLLSNGGHSIFLWSISNIHWVAPTTTSIQCGYIHYGRRKWTKEIDHKVQVIASKEHTNPGNGLWYWCGKITALRLQCHPVWGWSPPAMICYGYHVMGPRQDQGRPMELWPLLDLWQMTTSSRLAPCCVKGAYHWDWKITQAYVVLFLYTCWNFRKWMCCFVFCHPQCLKECPLHCFVVIRISGYLLHQFVSSIGHHYVPLSTCACEVNSLSPWYDMNAETVELWSCSVQGNPSIIYYRKLEWCKVPRESLAKGFGGAESWLSVVTTVLW